MHMLHILPNLQMGSISKGVAVTLRWKGFPETDNTAYWANSKVKRKGYVVTIVSGSLVRQ